MFVCCVAEEEVKMARHHDAGEGGRARGQWYGDTSWATLTGRTPTDAWAGDPKRNEDALLVEPRTAMFGVYDGNGKTKKLVLRSMELEEEDWAWAAEKLGVNYNITTQFDPDEVSRLVSRRMSELLRTHPATTPNSDAECGVVTSELREGVAKIHADIRGRCMMGSASTAAAIKLIPASSSDAMPSIVVVNVGDTRVVLGRNGMAVQVTRDRTVDKNIGADNFDIEAVNVHVERLQLEDEFLIIMSDGVYNAFEDENEGVIRFIRHRLSKREVGPNLAAQLVQHARQLEEARATPSSKIDDMTAVVILLKLNNNEQGALLAHDEDAVVWNEDPDPSSALISDDRSNTTRLLHLLTSIPRWQCALVAALVCVAVTMGLLFSFRA